MSEYITRIEFDALAEKVEGQTRTHLVILREMGDMKIEVREISLRVSRLEILLRRIARHLGVDPNGEEV